MWFEPVGLAKTLAFNGTLRTEQLELPERLLTRLFTDILVLGDADVMLLNYACNGQM